jgi:hypothetical protein
MIPYGKSDKLRKNHTDCHPKRLGKGVVNWWEVELGGVDKGAERQRIKRKIKEELNGESNKGQ